MATEKEYPKILLHRFRDEKGVSRSHLLPFNPNLVVYGKMEANKKGGKVVRCKYPIEGGQIDVRLQLPALRTPWGINESKEFPGSWSLSLSFDDKTEECKRVREVLEEWDQLIIAKAQQEVKTWFGSATDPKGIPFLYNKMVKPEREKDGIVHAPLINLKVYVTNGKPEFVLYDDNERALPDDVTKGMQLETLAEHSGIWNTGGKLCSAFVTNQGMLVNDDRIFGCGMVKRQKTGSSNEGEDGGAPDS